MPIGKHDPTSGVSRVVKADELAAQITDTHSASRRRLTAFSTQSDLCLRLSPLVSFMDCGGGKVWLEVGEPSHFRVSETGVVYTLRPLSLVGQGKATVVVYARDLQSKQVWKTKVHLRAGSQQVTQ